MELKNAQKALRKHIRDRGRGEASRLARACGVGLPLPGRWARGERTPTGYTEQGDVCEILERETGIPRAAWRKVRSSVARNDRTVAV